MHVYIRELYICKASLFHRDSCSRYGAHRYMRLLILRSFCNIEIQRGLVGHRKIRDKER